MPKSSKYRRGRNQIQLIRVAG
jgi:hypothetical protein